MTLAEMETTVSLDGSELSWLVFADWLEEHGDSGRAALIREEDDDPWEYEYKWHAADAADAVGAHVGGFGGVGVGGVGVDSDGVGGDVGGFVGVGVGGVVGGGGFGGDGVGGVSSVGGGY